MPKACFGLCLLLASHVRAANNACEAESGESPDEFVALQAAVRDSRELLHTGGDRSRTVSEKKSNDACSDDCKESVVTCNDNCKGNIKCGLDCQDLNHRCLADCEHPSPSLAATGNASMRMVSEKKSDDCSDDCSRYYGYDYTNCVATCER